MNQSRLNQLSQDITQAYLNKGYIHNPFQFEDKLSGFLIMRVLEGKVIKLTSKSDRVNLNTIAYHILGNPLKVQDLDQALDQANQMFGSRVTVDVLTQQDGGIHLDFVNEEQRRVNGFIGLDNNASKIYRRWQAKTGAYVDNPFGFSDMLHLGLTHSLKSFQHDYTQSASLLYRIPYGYKALSVYGSISKFKQQLPLKFNVLKQAGKMKNTIIFRVNCSVLFKIDIN
ncbi:hypothetical protein A6043_04480 [[Haemophilus] ducreyi]|uniref:ShlB/FhaC/HecB family hemolysin secretion/activation protein n=1 Tax=Haemophilus ducreyi TaxID=730 RepID=UPI0007CDE622|nr:ShlB/FhaC/HecB family hemolysin secretion/activation protein [[Haemophilus] ducreyi]ANF70618.1 hypothetical protein A6043_04480 [[Haemophilus] ducreyi]ANF72197.1 hypothetical protein A6044_04635 [[Haemophilus] ducreyi]